MTHDHRIYHWPAPQGEAQATPLLSIAIAGPRDTSVTNRR